MTTLHDAAKTVFDAAVEHAYEVGSVPAKPLTPYLVWSLTQDEPIGYTLDVAHGAQFQRVTWQSFGRTFGAADDIDRAATDALLNKSLTAAGYECGPCTTAFGGALGRLQGRDPDAGGLVGITSSLTFTARKES